MRRCAPSAATSPAVQLAYTFATAAGHDKLQHPETANRVTALQQSIAQHGFDNNPQTILVRPEQLTAPVNHRLESVLQLVHPASYLSRLQQICSSLDSPAMVDDSTYIAPGSYVACCEVSAVSGWLLSKLSCLWLCQDCLVTWRHLIRVSCMFVLCRQQQPCWM